MIGGINRHYLKYSGKNGLMNTGSMTYQGIILLNLVVYQQIQGLFYFQGSLY